MISLVKYLSHCMLLHNSIHTALNLFPQWEIYFPLQATLHTLQCLQVAKWMILRPYIVKFEMIRWRTKRARNLAVKYSNRSSNEQVSTGCQWSPPDVTSSGIQRIPEGEGILEGDGVYQRGRISQRGTLHIPWFMWWAYLPPIDRHLWKDYLPATSLAGGKYHLVVIQCVTSSEEEIVYDLTGSRRCRQRRIRFCFLTGGGGFIT